MYYSDGSLPDFLWHQTKRGNNHVTDAEYEKQKKRVRDLIDTYHRDLGFGWFRIDHDYEREVDREQESQVACTNVSWQYLQALITWNMPLVADQSDEKLREIFFHEYAHVLTAPLMQHVDTDNEAVQHLVEYTAETIARTIVYAVDYKPAPKRKTKSAKGSKK